MIRYPYLAATNKRNMPEFVDQPQGEKPDEESSDAEESSSRYSSTDHTGKHSTQSTESSLSLVRAETRMVLRIKVLVLLVIAIAAVTCGALTYSFVKDSEHRAFALQFEDFAQEVVDISHQEAYSMVKAVQSLSSTITSMVIAMEATFPNVTIPHFATHGRINNNISKALSVTFVPLIRPDEQLGWEAYTRDNQGWISESANEVSTLAHRELSSTTMVPGTIHHTAQHANGEPLTVLLDADDIQGVESWAYAPVWQQSPVPQDLSIINFNLFAHPTFARVFHGMWETKQPVLSEALELDFLYGSASDDDMTHPHSFLMEPIYPTFRDDHHRDDLAGMLVVVIGWDVFFSNILHRGSNGIVVVLHNSCGDNRTYQINGAEAVYMGQGDLHDRKYETLGQHSPFADFLKHNFSGTHEHCEYDLCIYPSQTLEDNYTTNRPFWFSLIVMLIFGCTALVFLLFDYAVAIRQNRVMAKAKRTHAIVSSLFPAAVRDRMLKDVDQQVEREMADAKSVNTFVSTKARLNDFLGKGAGYNEDLMKTKPIADLYPSATVMFADIVGFTAWSSAREPCQVFTLLETIYHAFDEIAKQRRVFKVETIGDCYVAVAGLPEPRRDHAIVMARFARDCLEKMNTLTKELETTLGPDTGDLCMRLGLHSGPVTAGVLRGDKGRFQLFGDTVNTAARMESTGERNRIHCSQETADIIEQAGKPWTRKREDLVSAKGKGEMQTFWLEFAKGSHSDPTRSVVSASDDMSTDTDGNWTSATLGGKVARENQQLVDKMQRLVDWNTDVFCRLLRQVVARKKAKAANNSSEGAKQSFAKFKMGTSVVDEVVEVIELPELVDTSAADAVIVTLDAEVVIQVRSYIKKIASMYRDNPFHNFEHASHVTMSVTKLLSRIVAPSDVLLDNYKDRSESDLISSLHDHTYGITSDPLTQFACVFAALIHDVDHPGVPNMQLVKEKTEMAVAYKGKSVAEQNSVNLAWDLLMDPAYTDFRQVLCSNDVDDVKRFRQLVVNAVMATDIMDADFKKLRDLRWTKAFSAEAVNEDTVSPESLSRNRKATIVLEHVIQASDVSHTMQHWHIYRKWNERFFRECMRAYQEGRADRNPADNWYKGELGFFDFYIIPLAKKLKECGVFGVSSDEYLTYAIKNRDEWALRGEEAVLRMAENHIALDGGGNAVACPQHVAATPGCVAGATETTRAKVLERSYSASSNATFSASNKASEAGPVSIERLLEANPKDLEKSNPVSLNGIVPDGTMDGNMRPSQTKYHFL